MTFLNKLLGVVKDLFAPAPVKRRAKSKNKTAPRKSTTNATTRPTKRSKATPGFGKRAILPKTSEIAKAPKTSKISKAPKKAVKKQAITKKASASPGRGPAKKSVRSAKPVTPVKASNSRRPVKTTPIKAPATRGKKASIPKDKTIKPSLRTAAKKTARPRREEKGLIGEVTHFFPKISVCAIRLSHGGLKKGMAVQFGSKSGAVERVESMQVESVDVVSARKGQIIGLKTTRPVRVGDKVFQAGA
jgi:hypothetical protein